MRTIVYKVGDGKRPALESPEFDKMLKSTAVAAFDHMIANNMWEYQADDLWNANSAGHVASLLGLDGQTRYRGEIFVVHHIRGLAGNGSMGNMGSPDHAKITRIRSTIP